MTIEKINEIYALAYKLMREHGLDKEGWTFDLSQTQRRIGDCYYDKKLIRFSINYLLKSSDAQIRDTILHEIAHALVGPDVKSHGYEWQYKAMQVGAEPYACDRTGRAISTSKPNYLMRCPSCDRQWERYRMRQRNLGSKCPDCKVTVEIIDLRTNTVILHTS